MKNFKTYLTIAALGTVLLMSSCEKVKHCQDDYDKAETETNMEYVDKQTDLNTQYQRGKITEREYDRKSSELKVYTHQMHIRNKYDYEHCQD